MTYNNNKFKPLRFGTSGLRALVSEMTDIECYINTSGFISFLKETGEINKYKKIIAIGGDLRSSTPRIIKAAVKSIEDSDCSADYCGLLPSPALANYSFRKNIPGIMVTGSHIPDTRNGIKFTRCIGEVLKSDEPLILENVKKTRNKIYKNPEYLFNKNGMFKSELSLPPVNPAAIRMYKERYCASFPCNILKNIKLVFYQHSAVGRDIITDIFKELGAEVITIGRSDKFIAFDTEKISEETTKILAESADRHKPFAIFSTDGDSDRPLLADETGQFITGDKLGALVSLFLKPDFAAVPVSANDAVISTLTEKNIEIKQTKIGSPYVIKAMIDKLSENHNSKVVSWESNGGFLTGSDWEIINGSTLTALPTRDAVLPILSTIILSIKNKLSLSELVKKYLPERYTYADLVRDFPREISVKIIEIFSPDPDLRIEKINYVSNEITNLDGTAEPLDFNKHKQLIKIKDTLINRFFTRELGFSDIKEIIFIDGIRIIFSNGDVSHLRPSGNAPEFRNYANADKIERAVEIVKTGLKIILPEMKKYVETTST